MKRLYRAIRSRPRLVGSVIIGLIADAVIPALAARPRGLVAWDIGCVVFLVLWAVKFSTTPAGSVSAEAERQNDGEWTIFALTLAGVVASFGAIIGEFSSGAQTHALSRVLLVGVTLFVSWLMLQTVFALRYAHEYYDVMDGGTGAIRGGLEFPSEPAPDYWDFFYFALVLGMTFQVSDVLITQRHFRRLAAAHGLLGFLFNTVIIALTVNLGAALLTPSSPGG